MIVLPDQPTVYFDVDDTLIKWYATDEEKEKFGVPVGNALPAPHKRHIEDLKDMKRKGYIVVVWSQGGAAHAEEVVRALDLEAYVDVIVSKPIWFWDDLHASDFMSSYFRVWREDE